MSSVCLEDVTARLTARLSESIGRRNYKMWFSDARIECDERELVLHAPNLYAARWIGSHYREQLQSAARQELHEELEVRIVEDEAGGGGRGAQDKKAGVAGAGGDMAAEAATPRSGTATPQGGSTTAQRVATVAARPRRSGGGAVRTPQGLRHRLEDYVVGESNRLAYGAACQLIDAASGGTADCLFIYGDSGLGKTHLLQGLCRRFAELYPGRAWRYTTAEQFTNEYLMSMRNNTLNRFRERLRRVELLAVDDVHFLSNKVSTQTEFVHTFDAVLSAEGAKVAMVGDSYPKQIGGLSEGLTSRWLSGMVARIDPPDVGMRLRLIRALALQRGLQLMDSVVPVIAECCHGSVREMEGMLTTLKALAMVEADAGSPQGPIGHALVNRLLGASGKMRPARPIRFQTIVEQVCGYLNLDAGVVLGRARQRRLVLARSVMVWLARRLTPMSFPDIARAMKCPNHSTVITAHQRIERDREQGKTIQLGMEHTGLPLSELIDQISRRVVSASV